MYFTYERTRRHFMVYDIQWVTLNSEALKDNPLHDPTTRRHLVLVPQQAKQQPLPVVFLLLGYAGKPDNALLGQNWGLSTFERIGRMIDLGQIPPALIVVPDCWTQLGGSQYLDSSATGNYETMLIHELVPHIDQQFRTNGYRVVMGKSSGGYGALVLGTRHPDIFHAVGSHSGDCYFEYGYLPCFPQAFNVLREWGGDIQKFLIDFREKATHKLPQQ